MPFVFLGLLVSHAPARGEETSYNRREEGLTQIPDDIPGNVTQIDLSHNSISIVPNAAFSSFTQLIYLYISHNLIREVNSDIWEGQDGLQYLVTQQDQLLATRRVYQPDKFGASLSVWQ